MFYHTMNSEIIKIIIITLSAISGLSCIYILGNFIFRKKGSLYIKGNAYLILDIDVIGDKLEYYVRQIENDIDSRYIYISQIILYSKNLNYTSEIFKICTILANSYNNIIFLTGNTDIELFLKS